MNIDQLIDKLTQIKKDFGGKLTAARADNSSIAYNGAEDIYDVEIKELYSADKKDCETIVVLGG